MIFTLDSDLSMYAVLDIYPIKNNELCVDKWSLDDFTGAGIGQPGVSDENIIEKPVNNLYNFAIPRGLGFS